MEAEREMNKLYGIHFMRDKLGKIFSGKISHTTPHGCFVLLDTHYVEGFIPSEELGPGARFDDRALAWIIGTSGERYELGRGVKAQVVSADLYERSLRFSLVNS